MKFQQLLLRLYILVRTKIFIANSWYLTSDISKYLF